MVVYLILLHDLFLYVLLLLLLLKVTDRLPLLGKEVCRLPEGGWLVQLRLLLLSLLDLLQMIRMNVWLLLWLQLLM